MNSEKHAMMWSLIAAGFAARNVLTAQQIVHKTDEVLKLYVSPADQDHSSLFSRCYSQLSEDGHPQLATEFFQAYKL